MAKKLRKELKVGDTVILDNRSDYDSEVVTFQPEPKFPTQFNFSFPRRKNGEKGVILELQHYSITTVYSFKIDKVKKKDSATGKVTIENVSSPNVTELKLIRAKVQFLDGVVCYLDSEDLYGKELI